MQNAVRRFSAGLLALIMVLSFTGCGNEGKVKADVTLKLALRAGTYADVIEKCIADFSKKYNIACEVHKLGEEELHGGIMSNASKPVGDYDFCMVDGSWMAEFTANNVLLNLSEYGYELDDDIIEATKAVCYHDGNVYLAPYYGNVTILLYNKRLAIAAGFPDGEMKSLDDIYTVCKYAADHMNYGFLYRGDTPNNIVVDFLPFLLSFGGWVVDENNDPTVDTQEFRNALDYYLKLIKTGKAESKDNLILAIVNQAAAMGVGWPGWYTPERNGQAEYAAITGKVSQDSAAYNANVYGIWTVGVTANSAHKEEAVKLLEYLMDPEVQKATVKDGGVPCRYSSLKDPDVLKKFPQYKPVCEALEGGVYRPIMAEWTDFYTILGGKMDLIIRGEKSVDAGLKEAQSELENMLNK